MTAHPPPLRSVPQSCRMRPRPSDGPAVAPIRGTGLLRRCRPGDGTSWPRSRSALRWSMPLALPALKWSHVAGGRQRVWSRCIRSGRVLRPARRSIRRCRRVWWRPRRRGSGSPSRPTVRRWLAFAFEAALLRRFLPSPPPRPAAVTQGDRRSCPLRARTQGRGRPLMPPHQHHGHASAWPDCSTPTPSSLRERRGVCVVADHRRRAASGVEPARDRHVDVEPGHRATPAVEGQIGGGAPQVCGSVEVRGAAVVDDVSASVVARRGLVAEQTFGLVVLQVAALTPRDHSVEQVAARQRASALGNTCSPTCFFSCRRCTRSRSSDVPRRWRRVRRLRWS